MATLGTLSEQIIRIAAGGDPAVSEPLDSREVRLLICQAASRQLKVEHFDINERAMEHLPPHMLIASYQVNPFPLGFSDGAIVTCHKLYQADRAPSDTLVAWVDETGAYWSTEDAQAWALYYAQGLGSLTITPIYDSNGGLDPIALSVTVSGNGLSAIGEGGIGIQEFISTCKSREGIVRFNTGGSQPATFAANAMGGVAVTDGNLSFIYDLTNVTSLNDVYNVISDQEGMSQYATSVIADTNKMISALLTINVGEYKESATWEGYSVFNVQCCGPFIDNESRAAILLPTTPITLPRNVGVWALINQQGEYYVPIQSGQYYIYSGISSSGLHTLLDTVKYFEWRDSRTLVLSEPFSSVDSEMTLQMLVINPSQWSDTDIVPLSADQEIMVIKEVLELLGVRPPVDLSQNNSPTR